MNIKKVKVGPFEYAIREVPRVSDADDGECSNRRQELLYSGLTLDGIDHTNAGKAEVIIHEVIHALDCVYNGDGLEEEVVQRLTIGILALAVDNKKIFKKVLDIMEKSV